MGFLHKGHISLIKESKKRADVTIVSVFVNPTQFAPNEDFSKYPRNIDKDTLLLIQEGTDFLFYPPVEEIYSKNHQTYVEVTEITKILEGEFRPTHYRGVTTIVAILFNSIKPDFAFFGQKDAQQAAVIRQMVDDLKYDIEIIECPIVREDDGLAMSSRNIFLSPSEREKALIINKSLTHAKDLITSGEHNVKNVIKKINNIFINESTIHLNYLRIVDSETFKEIEKLEEGNSYYVLVAAKVGNTRLIDNLLVQL
jgi:pantoate--beta-alanine ligase